MRWGQRGGRHLLSDCSDNAAEEGDEQGASVTVEAPLLALTLPTSKNRAPRAYDTNH